MHIQKVERTLLPFTAFMSGPVGVQAMPSADEHPLFYVGGLAIIGFLDMIFAMLASIVLILGTYRASTILFSQLLNGVMRATMRFVMASYLGTHHLLDSSDGKTPRLLGEFSTGCQKVRPPLPLIGKYWIDQKNEDFETIDTRIGMSFSTTLKCLCSVLLSVLTIVAISPIFVIPGTLIAFAVSPNRLLPTVLTIF